MRLTRFIPAAIAALTLLPEAASAQQVQFLGPKFTNQNTTTIGNPFAGGVADVGPYQMKFTTPGASAFDIYCIDFDNVFSAQTYNARILSFSDAVSQVLTFNGVDNYTALKRVLGNQGDLLGSIPDSPTNYLAGLNYTAAVAGQFGPTPTTAWDEIHYALWSAFNTNTIFSPDGVGGNVVGSQITGAVAAGGNFSNWYIILDESAWDRQAHSSYQQAVIAESVVPEPSSYALMGAGLLALGVAARRRNKKQA